jgi:hypothetical protein
MSIHTGKTANLEEIDESNASVADPALPLGSIIDASEDLDAILSKIGMAKYNLIV